MPKTKKPLTKKGKKQKAWNIFSKYIRTRDCLKTSKFPDCGKCITCGKFFPIQELQAGHAISGSNNSILFDEELVNAQCRGCYGYHLISNGFDRQQFSQKLALYQLDQIDIHDNNPTLLYYKTLC